MDIYLLRSNQTGWWLGRSGWTSDVEEAVIYSAATSRVGPAAGTEFVQFCECVF